ncbi:hypothetical protein ASJ30_05965 [Janibacter indicus]|uniref:Uncharacterized protein n=1 Tax=Janibacter indicus TaxID=857417 RepID=A0A1L3MFN2_9MICO|nr:hypothetical protein [Janibacter indicus]APH01142.1 hypothetical protein ASJ30_05965 [Janibacter indicus]
MPHVVPVVVRLGYFLLHASVLFVLGYTAIDRTGVPTLVAVLGLVLGSGVAFAWAAHDAWRGQSLRVALVRWAVVSCIYGLVLFAVPVTIGFALGGVEAKIWSSPTSGITLFGVMAFGLTLMLLALPAGLGIGAGAMARALGADSTAQPRTAAG